MNDAADKSAREPDLRFPIVGIGASAGGLEAFRRLLQRFPSDTGMALVLVQHLDPTHESELSQLLAKSTGMPVREVTDKLRIQPNHVYVIPPNANMSIAGGVLRLEPRAKERRSQHAIDFFFQSLAQDQAERAIGVVLSGTASDGTAGLDAIKGEGGITFAQDDSAKYNSMPRSAVAAGCVDFVLSPEDIAQQLARIAQHPFILGSPLGPVSAPPPPTAEEGVIESERDFVIAHQHDGTPLPAGGHDAPETGAEALHGEIVGAPPSPEEDGIKEVLVLLRNHCGVDFELYKSTTIQRRIARRMVLGLHKSFADYARVLRADPKELDTLFTDVLISVTSFFRNPEAFDILQRVAFPRILKQPRDGPIRVWVLGCSTGQEAYSIGMAFTEFLEAVDRPPQVQIFATDLNEALLEKARAGLYAKNIVEDLSPARLARFFTEEETGYRIIKPLRERVVFARQNMIADPPFSRMDLICCRNLLIYLEPSLQKKALPMFHYALRPDGFLFLGASESVGQFTDLFESVDRKQKIFAKKNVPVRYGQLPTAQVRSFESRQRSLPLPPMPGPILSVELSAQREADRLMVNEFAPPGVLIDSEFKIIQFRGATSPYLAPPRGKASFDVLKMVRDGLMIPLRTAINRARRDNADVRKEDVRFQEDGRARLVTIEVIPLRNLKERCYLVLFEEVPEQGGTPPARGARRVAARPAPPLLAAGKGERAAEGQDITDVTVLREQIADYERELSGTRDYLQAIQEQFDAASEELQASSEEARSVNEELQSINEELETSKEELQSTNEELTTVNEELANRNGDLNRVNADLSNLHVSIHTAILVVDPELRVRRFTPLAEKAFNLFANDVGRPLSGIRHNLIQPAPGAAHGQPFELEELIQEVMSTVSVREREVKDRQGHWFSLRARPYLSLDGRVDGAVLALVDIDALKRSEQEAEAARRYAEATIRTMRDPLLVLYQDLRVKTANDAFYALFRGTPEDTIGRPLFKLGDGQFDIPALRTLLEEILPRNSEFNDFEITHDFPGVGVRTVLLNGRRLDSDGTNLDLIRLAIEDITQRRAAENAVREASDRFRMLAESMPQMVFTADADGEMDYFNPQWVEYSGLPPEQIRAGGWRQLLEPEDLAPTLHALQEAIATGSPFICEHRFRRSDGEYRWHVTRAIAIRSAGGMVERWVGSSTDIHDVKISDQRKDEFLAMLAHELRNALAPIGNALQILQHTKGAGETAMSAVQMLHRQFGQAVRLMDDLLDVSRISRGKISLHRERIRLGKVIDHAVESVRGTIDRLEQELKVELPADPIYLFGDVTRLVQIVGNLLSNASKFTERRGRIRLAATREGEQAVIRVQDTGIGIAGDQLSKIFDMFVQVDTSLERTQGGLGIGLTLVKKLIEMHGGTIEAHSRGLGYGAEFVVRLPLGVEPAAAVQPDSPGSVPAPATEPTGRRVLVVDDNTDSASSLAMMLTLFGHEVRTANDGVAAVEAATTWQPDVVLLDIGLPKLNGYEAGRQIRQQLPDAPMILVAVTGWGQEGDRSRSKEAGFDFHLVKPVDPAALVKILETVPARSS